MTNERTQLFLCEKFLLSPTLAEALARFVRVFVSCGLYIGVCNSVPQSFALGPFIWPQNLGQIKTRVPIGDSNGRVCLSVRALSAASASRVVPVFACFTSLFAGSSWSLKADKSNQIK